MNVYGPRLREDHSKGGQVLRSHICCSARRDPIDILADLLRRFEIDDELEFNISWFDAVEMLFT